MFLVYNSDILSESNFQLALNDRAFQYGDGLFETIRYENSTVWFWSDHFDRLTTGMSAMQLSLPSGFTAETIYQRIRQVLSANDLANQDARIKIQVWRKPGGLYTPATKDTNVLITAQAGHSFSVTEKTKVGLYKAFRLSPSPVSAFKTLNALPYVLAGLYKQQNNFDEVILLDTKGYLAECLASNLFWLTGRTLFTPSLQTGCINGIIRRQLLRLAQQSDISIVEGLYPLDTLSQANALFCANVMGIQWLHGLNDVQVDTTESAFENATKLLNPLFAQLHR
ncbi:aminotransferase class IV [Spirosoma sp. KNUC1025]|uniref:aminotransferase class IV n=1 Tax=Spirosoma sp. KNUC1025 TaxID=2894082 RepID=UPI003865566E|nr:aminotransferase class IV [Spirosoma sp. KNUC1025]